MKNKLLSIASVAMIGIMFSATHSYAFNWCKAPLACLPDRAVKWENNTAPEPCHCPPKSYCVALNLEPADIDFIVTPHSDGSILDYDHAYQQPTFPTITIKGSEVPQFANKSLTLKDIIAMKNETYGQQHGSSVATLFRTPYLNKTQNVESPNTALLRPEWMAGRTPMYGIDLLETYGLFKMDFTIQVNNPSKITNWINSQKMPLSLASRCCDSVCPEGLTPEIGNQSVTKQKAHITFTQQEITKAKTDFIKIVDTIYGQIPKAPCPNPCGNPQPDPNLPPILLSETYNTNQAFHDALVAALNNLKTALDALYSSPSSSQAVISVNTNIKQFMIVYDTSISDIKTMTVTEYTAVIDFYTKIKQEVDVINNPTQVVKVDTLTCKAKLESYREGCILKGTPITLSDGTTKPIEELNVGDEVLGNQGVAKIKAKSRFSQEVDHMYSINGGKAFFTVEHPLLTPKGWKSIDPNITSTKKGNTVIIGPLQVGDTLLLKDGKTVEVKSIEKVEVKDNPDAYNLSIEGDGSFIANGFIMKGFKQMQMHY